MHGNENLTVHDVVGCDPIAIAIRRNARRCHGRSGVESCVLHHGGLLVCIHVARVGTNANVVIAGSTAARAVGGGMAPLGALSLCWRSVLMVEASLRMMIAAFIVVVFAGHACLPKLHNILLGARCVYHAIHLHDAIVSIVAVSKSYETAWGALVFGKNVHLQHGAVRSDDHFQISRGGARGETSDKHFLGGIFTVREADIEGLRTTKRHGSVEFFNKTGSRIDIVKMHEGAQMRKFFFGHDADLAGLIWRRDRVQIDLCFVF